MKMVVLAAALLAGGPLAAQERHPLLEKIIEVGVAGQVVSAKCSGWSVNPDLIAQLMVAIGMSGLSEQLGKIDGSEVAARAERVKVELWPPEKTAQQCAEATGSTVPNPFRDGEAMPLFIFKAP